MEAAECFLDDVLLDGIIFEHVLVFFRFLKYGVSAMVLKEHQLLIRQENAQKQGKIGVDADEASDVQVLFEARRSLLAQLHFFPLLADAAEVAEALTIGRLEVLCRLNLAVDAPEVCLVKRLNRLICPETGLQG